MKTQRWNSILAGIGTIVALALIAVPLGNAEAQTDSMQVWYKLQGIDTKITLLEETNKEFNIDKLASQEFKFRIVGESLLDIQKSNDIETYEGQQINQVLESLITDYKKAFNDYINQITNKQHTLSMNQRQVITNLVQNYMNFETNTDTHEEKLNQKTFVKNEIKKLDEEAKFQTLINKVGIDLAHSYIGNRVPNISHEIALEKIVDSQSWDLVCTALDRIINQHSNDEIKTTLLQYKEQIEDNLVKIEKTNKTPEKILTLTNDADDPTSFFAGILNSKNDIQSPGIVISQLKDEIKSVIQETRDIISESKIELENRVNQQKVHAEENDGSKKTIESAPEPEKISVGNSGDQANDNAKEKANEQAIKNPQNKDKNNDKN